jgi:uracil-DNA glycosylase family protein
MQTRRPSRPGAQGWVSATASVPALADAARDCRGCELWEPATQVVFSSGDPHGRIMLVGEQPGEHEDRQGTPFVGPAGQLLARALDEAGIAAREVYLTNAVKHFRFEQKGKRRIHRTPDLAHLIACRPWLEAELDVVDPDVVVALGAVATRSLLGPEVRVTRERGHVLAAAAGRGERLVVPTVHPSSVLRGPPEDRHQAFADFVADLRVARAALADSA